MYTYLLNVCHGKNADLNIEDIYHRFKSLHETLKENPHAPESFRNDVRDDLKSLSCVLFYNKGLMEILSRHHAEDAKLIEHIAQEQDLQHQEKLHQEQIQQRKIHDRGAYSL
ncbi:MAG: hypothetical protein HYX35_02840 [Proteobacteria bacterium]|nr:hypothetical protein [Pseudomonadota bacterium]